MSGIEKFSQPKEPSAEQVDFFEVLDNIIPNEDVQEIALDKFGTSVRFDPKESGRFIISSTSAQMTTIVEFTPTGDISRIETQRWYGESGAIEKSFRERFKKDAEFVIKNHPDLLQIGK